MVQVVAAPRFGALLFVGLGVAAGCGDEAVGAMPDAAAAPVAAGTGAAAAAGAAGAPAGATAAPGGGTGAAAASAADAAAESGCVSSAAGCPDASDTTASLDAGVAVVDASATDAGSAAAGCTPCDSYAAPTLLANVQSASLAELSGMAAAVRTPGVLFVHNDRARPVLYALSEDGALRGSFSLSGANVADVEDLATGPCDAPSGRCLFLADIGGNITPRTEFGILRAEEPAVAADGAPVTSDLSFVDYRFHYDDGQNHNAEGIVVDPADATVYVVTKVAEGQPSSVYVLPNPMSEAGDNVATLVTELPVPAAQNRAASAAAAHPCGVGFALRTYDAIYEFRVPPGGAFVDAFSAEPREVPSASEPQSEAITYTPDGRALITTGEAASAPIYRSACN